MFPFCRQKSHKHSLLRRKLREQSFPCKKKTRTSSPLQKQGASISYSAEKFHTHSRLCRTNSEHTEKTHEHNNHTALTDSGAAYTIAKLRTTVSKKTSRINIGELIEGLYEIVSLSRFQDTHQSSTNRARDAVCHRVAAHRNDISDATCRFELAIARYCAASKRFCQ